MPLSAGTSLGHYDVTSLLREGGMGQVWQATDTQLGREVALKILPDAFAADPDRLARFTREAQILASLNHPNIAQIHGIEEAEGTRALVLELVEGPTLADRIAKGPIPLDEALPIAKQIAEALEAAHEAGVIHRDLKPANIKVREDGTVKVLDFGLAKALDPLPEGDPSQSPTLTAAATQMGIILGTAAYMSPEQAKGKPVDRRADIWAFGVVLYEMLTGTQLFGGEDVSDSLAAILRAEPDLQPLPSDAPRPIRHLIRRCLEKDRTERLAHIGEARFHIREALTEPSMDTVAGTPQRAGVWKTLPFIAALVAGATVAGISVWLLEPPPASPSSPLVRFAIHLPPSVAPSAFGNQTHTVAVSPVGTHVVYTDTPGASTQLVVRPFDQLSATTLPGLGTQVSSPFISPDGAWLGFFDLSSNALKKVSILGGLPNTIGELENQVLRGASWGQDDMIVFGTSQPSGLWRVAAGGGDPESITSVDADRDATNHAWPEILPGGRGILFTILSGSIDRAQIAVLDLDSGQQTSLVPGSYPRYAPTGHIVYVAAGSLRAVPFDLERLDITGSPPVSVLEDVFTNTSGAAEFGWSRDGTLVYMPAAGASGGVERTLVWVDREGRETPIGAPARVYTDPDISPDGNRVALTVRDSQDSDVWIWDLTRRTLTPLTLDPALDEAPVWTPDGTGVVFQSSRGGGGLFRQAADGTGQVEQLMQSSNLLTPWTWSADGRLVYVESGLGGRDIVALTVDSERSTEVLLAEEFAEQRPAISPDGRWIAYQSDESGQYEVYVRPFPNVDAGKSTVSTGGGAHPVWSPDGEELFYLSPDDQADNLMVVQVDTEPTFSAGTPEIVFGTRGYVLPVASPRIFDISADGQRFLMLKAEERRTTQDENSPQLIVVQNWFEELKRLVPIP